MKKIVQVVALGILAMFLLSACAAFSRPDWLDYFYNANYEYRKSTINIRNDTEQVVNVYEGKVISSPYKEYMRVVKPKDSSLGEVYYSGNGKMVKAVLHRNNEYTTRPASRSYPYGYGQKLTFKKDRVENYNEQVCTVYTTEYSEDLSNIVNPDAGTAKVSQEYYVDNESDRLLCIITDLTDLNHKTEALNYGFSTESTSETQESKVITVEKLEILSYNDEISITIPDI